MPKMLELAEKNFKEANSNYCNEAFQNMLIMAKKEIENIKNLNENYRSKKI